jgi:hypothetical protein
MQIDLKDLNLFIKMTLKNHIFLPETIKFFQDNNDLYQKMSPGDEGVVEGIFRAVNYLSTKV